ncbi:MAG: DoxX family protein [Myxococcaceae bacterium]
MRHTQFHVAGRVLLAIVFVVSGMAKLTNFDATVGAMDTVGVASPSMFLSIAIAIELVCGAFLFVGYRVRATAVFLAVYLAAVTLLIHGDLTLFANRNFAIANVGLIGGLIGLMSHGAGRWSLDVVRAKQEAKAYGI